MVTLDPQTELIIQRLVVSGWEQDPALHHDDRNFPTQSTGNELMIVDMFFFPSTGLNLKTCSLKRTQKRPFLSDLFVNV